MTQPLRVLLATDACRPQVNGVVRTWETSIDHLRHRGQTVAVVEPGLFPRVRAPFYQEIRLALPGRRRVAELVRSFGPDVVHVATEGPIGLAVRAFCRRNRRRFSTSYHTRFREHLQRLAGVPLGWSYGFMRWFPGARWHWAMATRRPASATPDSSPGSGVRINCSRTSSASGEGRT